MSAEYTSLLNERHQQEDRLRALGFDVDGGGVSLTEGFWEIFVYLHPSDPNDVAVILDGVGDVDKFIAEHSA